MPVCLSAPVKTKGYLGKQKRKDNKMTPQFDINGYDIHPVLKCASCGSTYLHPSSVDVYTPASEDNGYGTRVHVDVAANSCRTDLGWGTQAGNPSPCRTGIVIRFACEECHTGTTLLIWQHKQQFPECLEPQSSSRFLVWPFVNLHAIIRFKAHSIAPF